jgi:hypothetical protein
MHNREYALGVLDLLNDHTVAAQTLVVSALLDAATHRPEPQWSSLQNADSRAGNTFGGGGYGGGYGGGALGPEVLTWYHRAFGYCGNRYDDQLFITEVGLHARTGFALAPVAAAIGLEPSTDPGAYPYRVDVEVGFPNFHGSSDDVRMLALWLKHSGIGEPLGASKTIAGRMNWVRRHWRLGQQAASIWDMLTGDKPSVNYHVIETDLLTWVFDTGDVTTQFVARPIRPSEADGLERDFNKTINAARKLTERVRDILRHTPITGETLRRRLSAGDGVGGTQS